jgi:hypothetical protein
MKSFALLLVLFIFLPFTAPCQNIEKVVFDTKDTTDGYYLAVRPRLNNIKGVLVLCTSFSTPEWMLPETKLHNVAYANDLLTILFSIKQKLYADTPTLERLNALLKHVAATYATDTSKFVLAGYDFAGNAILRYAELTQQHPSQFGFQPKAVFAIGSPVDLFGLWTWCERQIKRKSRSAWDANYIRDLMTKEQGTIYTQKDRYQKLSPFYAASDTTGNEQYLKDVPVRLYYDVDAEWHLKERQNSLYDTFLPEGTELISRLLLLGNKDAELIMAKQPGRNSRGIRTTNSLSIVDEVDCIHWIKNKLDIFDPNTTITSYNLFTPSGWTEERFPMPIDFAPQINHKGLEDVRFAPGWGDPKSEEYWSYAYLWWLEGSQQIDAATLQMYLKAYYDGLVARNVKERNIPADKVIPTKVTIKNTKTAPDNKGTFEGMVRMLDYMTQQPITLHFRVHVKNCTEQDRTAVFIELSPKPYKHAIWMAFDRIHNRFECDR